MDEVEQFDAMMNDELKGAVNDVLKALESYTSEKLNSLSNLPMDIVEGFLYANSINVPESLKKQMTTPYSIAKYLLLKEQEREMIEKVETELENTIDAEKVNWLIYKDLTNRISFSKRIPINSDEVPQSLSVKYKYDSDNDKLIYSISDGSWGWEISLAQLKSILENKTISPISESISKHSKAPADVKFLTSMTDNEIVINSGQIKIIVQKC